MRERRGWFAGSRGRWSTWWRLPHAVQLELLCFHDHKKTQQINRTTGVSVEKCKTPWAGMMLRRLVQAHLSITEDTPDSQAPRHCIAAVGVHQYQDDEPSVEVGWPIGP